MAIEDQLRHAADAALHKQPYPMTWSLASVSGFADTQEAMAQRTVVAPIYADNYYPPSGVSNTHFPPGRTVGFKVFAGSVRDPFAAASSAAKYLGSELPPNMTIAIPAVLKNSNLIHAFIVPREQAVSMGDAVLPLL